MDENEKIDINELKKEMEKEIEKELDNEIKLEKKEIEIVNGDGNLDISPVYDHIDIERPDKDKEKKQIVIPEEKKKN